MAPFDLGVLPAVRSGRYKSEGTAGPPAAGGYPPRPPEILNGGRRQDLTAGCQGKGVCGPKAMCLCGASIVRGCRPSRRGARVSPFNKATSPARIYSSHRDHSLKDSAICRHATLVAPPPHRARAPPPAPAASPSCFAAALRLAALQLRHLRVELMLQDSLMQKDHSQRLAHAALRSAPLTCRNAPAARDRGLGCVVPADVVGVGVGELGRKRGGNGGLL